MWRVQQLWLRLRALLRRDRVARELDDEIQFHLDQQIAENVASGMNRQEARYAALRAFGNPTVLKEETQTRGGGCGSRTSRRTCATPYGCWANLLASPPSPSSPWPSASVPTPRSSPLSMASC